MISWREISARGRSSQSALYRLSSSRTSLIERSESLSRTRITSILSSIASFSVGPLRLVIPSNSARASSAIGRASFGVIPAVLPSASLPSVRVLQRPSTRRRSRKVLRFLETSRKSPEIAVSQ